MTVETFYDEIAPYYHLIHGDWTSRVERQATELEGIIKEIWGTKVETILDLACGIGTQSLGLAQLCYKVTASDLSPAALERARREAEARSLRIDFSLADMREASAHHHE